MHLILSRHLAGTTARRPYHGIIASPTGHPFPPLCLAGCCFNLRMRELAFPHRITGVFPYRLNPITADIVTALQAYEAARLPATARIVQDNRAGGPERVIDLVEERAPHGFAHLDEVASYAERAAIVTGYAKTAGFDHT
jgi:hypothetical protein